MSRAPHRADPPLPPFIRSQGCCGTSCDLETGECACLAAEGCECCDQANSGGPGVKTAVFEFDLGLMYPGQVINSDIGSTIMQMVPGPVAMVGFLGEVIDEDGNSVPLDEVYNHHSVYAYHDNSVPYVAEGMSPQTLKSQQETYAAGLSFSGGPCTTYESAGGVGAEGRNTGQWSPAGFGYV